MPSIVANVLCRQSHARLALYLLHSLLLPHCAPCALQGCGQQALTKTAGDGFATDATVITSKNLSDPTTFFKTLLLRPYLRQVLAVTGSLLHRVSANTRPACREQSVVQRGISYEPWQGFIKL